MAGFIDEKKIQELLDFTSGDAVRAKSLLEKAKDLKGLSPEEVAVLLNCADEKFLQDLFETANLVKNEIYGNRLVMFAPLYVTNICINNCLYCGFRKDNTDLIRRQLTQSEVRADTKRIIEQGHKRILLVAGEDPKTSNLDYVKSTIETIYGTVVDNGNIRRLNVNVAPLSVEDFRRLKDMKIGTYQLFQETYHPETYKKMHPSGPKANYVWRLHVMDRAMEAGIDDVGIGALFGLYDHKFEMLALLYHAMHLEQKFGCGPHTISVPRLKPALNAPSALDIPYPVSDLDFKKIVAILRIAVPYTGIILSTRESAKLRDDIFDLGVSQISAGSRTNPGAYEEESKGCPESEQFSVDDMRTQEQVIKDVIKKGFLPSFCTACYRRGRTGKDFMDLAKPGDIKTFCQANCILTFKEYLLDYADEELKREGSDVIDREIAKIPDLKVRESTLEKLRALEKGERDLYF